MTVITMTDDRGGMLFNGRRLSQDQAVIQKTLELTGRAALWTDGFSKGLFAPAPENLKIDRNFLEKAGEKDVCFDEDRPLLPQKDRIGTLIVFHWNRRYPSDQKLDLNPADAGMRLAKKEEFPGKSHEKITMEVWCR